MAIQTSKFLSRTSLTFLSYRSPMSRSTTTIPISHLNLSPIKTTAINLTYTSSFDRLRKTKTAGSPLVLTYRAVLVKPPLFTSLLKRLPSMDEMKVHISTQRPRLSFRACYCERFFRRINILCQIYVCMRNICQNVLSSLHGVERTLLCLTYV